MVSSRPPIGSYMYPWSQVDHLSAASCIHGLKWESTPPLSMLPNSYLFSFGVALGDLLGQPACCCMSSSTVGGVKVQGCPVAWLPLPVGGARLRGYPVVLAPTSCGWGQVTWLPCCLGSHFLWVGPGHDATLLSWLPLPVGGARARCYPVGSAVTDTGVDDLHFQGNSFTFNSEWFSRQFHFC